MWIAIMWVFLALVALPALIFGALWASVRWGYSEEQWEQIDKFFDEELEALERMKKSGKITEEEYEMLSMPATQVEKELDEVERMRESGEITEKEREILRKKIITDSDKWWGVGEKEDQ